MAGQSFAMIGCSWTEVSVLGSQLFGRALMESSDIIRLLIYQICSLISAPDIF